MALRWFCSRSLLRHDGLTKELIDRIPGRQTDRKTPLGELNWIFTAITDTIAWNMLPRALFQKLFRSVCGYGVWGMGLGHGVGAWGWGMHGVGAWGWGMHGVGAWGWGYSAPKLLRPVLGRCSDVGSE